jgi:putative ABC transport system permease protein
MVILRYLVRSIFEKKFQSFLLFLSIAVAATLVFSSLTVTQTMQELNREITRSEVGNSDIVIEPVDEPDVPLAVDSSPLAKIDNSCEYVLEVMQCHVLYKPSVEEEEYFATWGADIKTLSRFTELSYAGDAPESLAEDEVIISAKTADRLGYKVGDSIELDVHAHPGTYKIVALCQSKGIFIDEAHIAVMIMNKDRLDEIFETDGIPNIVFLGLKDGVVKDEVIEKLSPLYPKCVVEDSTGPARASSKSADSSVSFIIVSVFAVLVSAFIIYTSYRVITTERLPVIGTFRSVGATKKRLTLIYLAESASIGAIGGIAGILLGIPSSVGILSVNAPSWITDVASSLQINPVYVVATFIFAVLLSVLSSAVPIITSSGRPLKEVLLGVDREQKEGGIAGAIVGAVLILCAVVFPPFLPKGMVAAIVANSIVMTAGLVGIVLLIPLTCRVFGTLMLKIGMSLKANTLAIAAGNTRGNRSLLNNTILTSISLASLIFIYTLSGSLSQELDRMFEETTKFDIYLVYNNATNEDVSTLGQHPGVSNVSAVYQMEQVPVSGASAAISYVYGMQSESYFDFWKFDFRGDREEALRKMNDEHGIILASRMADLLGAKEGDHLTLTFNTTAAEYTVCGIFDTLWDSGNLALISDGNMRKDANPRGYSTIYIQTDEDPAKVQDSLKNTFLTDIRYSATHNEIEQRSSDGIVAVFTVLKTFTQVALLISVVGIANNLILSFLERKKTFAIYRSIGADKAKISWILAIESTMMGLLAVVTGSAGATLLLSIVPNIISTIVGPIRIHYSIETYLLFAGAALILLILSALIPAVKASRQNLVESIKYE